MANTQATIGIKLFPVLKYHLAAIYGVVETKVKALKSLLRLLVQSYYNWEDCLPVSLFDYQAILTYNLSIALLLESWQGRIIVFQTAFKFRYSRMSQTSTCSI